MAVDCTAWHEVEREMSRANREGKTFTVHCLIMFIMLYEGTVCQVRCRVVTQSFKSKDS